MFNGRCGLKQTVTRSITVLRTYIVRLNLCSLFAILKYATYNADTGNQRRQFGLPVALYTHNYDE